MEQFTDVCDPTVAKIWGLRKLQICKLARSKSSSNLRQRQRQTKRRDKEEIDIEIYKEIVIKVDIVIDSERENTGIEIETDIQKKRDIDLAGDRDIENKTNMMSFHVVFYSVFEYIIYRCTIQQLMARLCQETVRSFTVIHCQI